MGVSALQWLGLAIGLVLTVWLCVIDGGPESTEDSTGVDN